MSKDPTVIVAGARTPMGRMSGSLKGFSGSDLGGFAIKGALEKSGVKPEDVDYVIMGQVLYAGEGQIPARQAAVKAGIPMSVPALSLNKVCLSGIDAIALADQLIRAGEFEIIVAGGQESMTNAPHLLEKSRDGFKYGNVTLRDHMDFDALSDVFTMQGMGGLTESANTGERAVTREELWGTGNRETLGNAFLSRNSILLYALKTHHRNRERFAQECEALAAEKRVVRLRSRRDVERFALSPLP